MSDKDLIDLENAKAKQMYCKLRDGDLFHHSLPKSRLGRFDDIAILQPLSSIKSSLHEVSMTHEIVGLRKEVKAEGGEEATGHDRPEAIGMKEVSSVDEDVRIAGDG